MSQPEETRLSAPIAPDHLPIIQYWHSGTVPDDVAKLIASFARHNPDRPHLLFDQHSAETFIATHFSDVEVGAFRTCALPQMQADYFRYCAAHALGGVCVDADCYCVDNLESLFSCGSGRLFRRDSGGVINGLFAFNRPRHPLPSLALDIATANIHVNRLESVWAMTGPFVLTALLSVYEQGSIEMAANRISQPPLRRLVEAFQDTISHYSRVVEAFEGVHVCPFDEVFTWIGEADPIPLYKDHTRNEKAMHWMDPRGSIFKDAPHPT